MHLITMRTSIVTRTKHITDAELMKPLLKKPRGKPLTKKQEDFAKAVADGVSGVAAYRKAYNTNEVSEHHRKQAYKLKQHPDIAQTIEALQRAKEAAQYHEPAQIRAFITSELLKHVSNEEAKLSDRLNALKLLGTLSDVAAYTERKEVLNVKASIDIKQQLMEKLKLIGGSSTPQANSSKLEADSGEADSLLQELRDDPNVIDGQLIEQGADFPAPDSVEADSQIDDGESAAPKA